MDLLNAAIQHILANSPAGPDGETEGGAIYIIDGMSNSDLLKLIGGLLPPATQETKP